MPFLRRYLDLTFYLSRGLASLISSFDIMLCYFTFESGKEKNNYPVKKKKRLPEKKGYSV